MSDSMSKYLDLSLIKNAAVLRGDCVEQMKRLPDCSVDSVVTDPPYGLSKEPDVAEVMRHWLAGDDYKHSGGGFMGRSWDSFVPGPHVWRECYRVLRPGGYALVFGGTRTHDLLGIALRMAGFEIRDCLKWVFGSGFPKSCSLPNGWGSAAKPAWEAIWVCRRPLDGTLIANFTKYGTGGLNIDGCRVATSDTVMVHFRSAEAATSKGIYGDGAAIETHQTDGQKLGRWPANILLGHSEGCQSLGLSRVKATSGLRPSQVGTSHKTHNSNSVSGTVSRAWTATHCDEDGKETVEAWECVEGCPVALMDGQSDRSARFFNQFRPDVEDAAFFYSAKASVRDREEGCEGLTAKAGHEMVEREEDSAGTKSPRAGAGRTAKGRKNHHCTVKPTPLMAWLCRLVTPPNGIILDPFGGSGSTGKAAILEGFKAILIERDLDNDGNPAGYIDIIQARLKWAIAERARLADKKN